MARKAKTEAELLEDLLWAIQNLFILEGLRSGMQVGQVRKILKIDKTRVSNISTPLKKAQRLAARKKPGN
jgi:hypothetical protein